MGGTEPYYILVRIMFEFIQSTVNSIIVFYHKLNEFGSLFFILLIMCIFAIVKMVNRYSEKIPRGSMSSPINFQERRSGKERRVAHVEQPEIERRSHPLVINRRGGWQYGIIY